MPVIINGEVVPDGDPRAVAYRRAQEARSQPSSETSAPPMARPVRGPQASAAPPAGAPPGGMPDPFLSMFPTGFPRDINQQLQAYVRPFPIMGIMVQPGLLAIALFVLFLFNIRGLLIFLLLLYFFSQRRA
jgi:hypothetical protein